MKEISNNWTSDVNHMLSSVVGVKKQNFKNKIIASQSMHLWMELFVIKLCYEILIAGL